VLAALGVLPAAELARAAVVRRAAAVRARPQVQRPAVRGLQDDLEVAPILPAPRA
jgi:hypothetical protein